MSQNYLEIARIVSLASETLPAVVQSIELVEFPIKSGPPDLNVALRFDSRKILVFSLKSPWTGIFFTDTGGLWRQSKGSGTSSWSGAFGGNRVPDWNTYLKGQILEKIESPAGERLVRLEFGNGAELEVQLFPARPNWCLRVGGEEFWWRKLNESSARPAFVNPSLGGTQRPESVLREFPINGKVDLAWEIGCYRHYLALRQEAALKAAVQRAQAQIQNRLSHLIKIRGQMMGALSESKNAELVKKQGEMLKAVLHEYPKNYKTYRMFEIELDPKLTLADNSNQLFQKYKKLQRTNREVQARLVGIEEQTKTATSSIAQIRSFQRNEDESFEKAHQRLFEILLAAGMQPSELEGSLEGAVAKKQSKKEKKWAESGIRRFISKEGLLIWVGRNHQENEELVIRMARGNDIWLHLKGRPGAHVVVQLPQGKSCSLETLLDAATLVAYYSDITTKEKVEVDYTFRKYVKRVPGNNKDKFLVTYSQNKTLVIKVEEARLSELLGRALSLK